VRKVTLTREQITELIIRHAREVGIKVKPEQVEFVDLDDERLQACFEAQVTVEED
jgi:hypothetical protein